MCPLSTPWLCPASYSSDWSRVVGRYNQFAVQPDAPIARVMPPLTTAGLAALPASLHWNQFLTVLVLCSLIIMLLLAARRWKTSQQIGMIATHHHTIQDFQPPQKSDGAGCYDISASQPFIYLPPLPPPPPPAGSLLTAEPRAGQMSPLPLNSGTLAAQAMAKLRLDPLLHLEAEARHPWRRHSHPLSKAIPDDQSNLSIKRDEAQYFDDADMNGFWRRRTLEFA
jgi:hypothetical protein